MYDTTTNDLAMAFPSDILDGIIATQLARACIVPKEYGAPLNSKEQVPGKKVVANQGEEESIRSVIGFPPYHSSPLGLEEFWTVQVVNAFKRNTESNDNPPVITYDSPVGNHKNYLIIMYTESIQARLDGEGISNQFNTIYPILLLHEIGHALWLKEALGENETPDPNVTYGVMLNKGPLGSHLVDDNDKFIIKNLKDIQAMGVPEAGSGWNHPK